MQATAARRNLPGLELLEQTPGILAKMLVVATPDEFDWKPSAERWSITEVLAHLVDVEVACFQPRARAMVEQDSPAIEPYDQMAAWAQGKYSNGNARELLRGFHDKRAESLAWLKTIPAAARERGGQHAELGRITLGQLMNEWAFHDLGHIRQIAELFRARSFYAQMGPFQRYYTVKP